MAKQRKSFYAVRRGRETGVFTSWAQVEPLIYKFPGAQHKGFETRAQAELWVSTAMPVSPSKRTSNGGIMGSQSPRLDRSPRKPATPSRSTILAGFNDAYEDEPPSPTRSGPRKEIVNDKPKNGPLKSAKSLKGTFASRQKGWCPTTSEAEMAQSMFNLIQQDPWIPIQVEGRLRDGKAEYEIYFGPDSSQNVARPVIVYDHETLKEWEERAVLVAVYEACKLIHRRDDGLKYSIETTSLFAIQCIYTHCPVWEAKGWMEDGKPVPHRDVLEKTVNLLHQLKGRVNFVKLKEVTDNEP